MALCWPPANVYLLACYNFGIQEYSAFGETTREVFDGCPEMKDGYLYANEKPGWGIEINEKATAKYPFGVQWWPRRRKKIDSVYDFIPSTMNHLIANLDAIDYALFVDNWLGRSEPRQAVVRVLAFGMGSS